MNSSLWSAGHTTHLKIVAVSLIASIVVVAIEINARFDSATTRAPKRIILWSRPANRRSTQTVADQQFAECSAVNSLGAEGIPAIDAHT